MGVLARNRLNGLMLQQKRISLVMREQKKVYKNFKFGYKDTGKMPLSPESIIFLVLFQVNVYPLKISGNW